MVAVGATNVGSIVVDFDPELKTSVVASNSYQHEINYSKPVSFKKGDDFGFFNFGSTIVLIFNAPFYSELSELEDIRNVKVGQSILN